ncbi:MAG: hypothetical protein Q8M15_05535 [Bacteroidota bacterium]|nr:hypothetical protein [Bacteroidota bacterium]
MKKRDKFEEKLNEQLSGMEFKPSDSLWNRIEQNLDTDGFEPAMREKLESFTAEPTQKVWTHIENQLPEMRNRKGIFWISMTAVILAIGFGAGYWFSPKLLVSNDKITNTQTETFHQPAINPNGNEGSNINASKKDPRKAEDLISTSVNDPEKKSLPVLISKTPVNKGVPAKASQPLAIKNITKSKNAKELAEGNRLPVTSQNKNTGIAQKGNPDQGLVSTLAGVNENIPAKQDKNVISPETQKMEQPTLPNSKNELPKPEETKPLVLPIPEKITQGISPVVSNDALTPKDTSEVYSNENVLVDKSAYLPPGDSLSNISITATVGAQLCFLSLSMPEDYKSTLQKSFDLRQKMETPVIDYNGGFLLNYHFSERWMLSSGVMMTSFTQDINYSLIPPVGNPVPQPNKYLHPTDSIEAGTQKVLQNKYSFTEIPLLLTYKAVKGQSVDVEMQAGISYAVLNLVNAYMPDPTCIGLLEVTDKDDFPKLKNLFFVSLAPSIGYKLNNAITLGAMPHIKVSLTGMVDNDNWIQQKPWFVGLNLFMRKRF